MGRNYTPEQYRDWDLRKDFGITLGEYRAMAAAQGDVYAICGQPETATRLGQVLSLAVDHHHATGQVRSLLCRACNLGLGAFREDPELSTSPAPRS